MCCLVMIVKGSKNINKYDNFIFIVQLLLIIRMHTYIYSHNHFAGLFDFFTSCKYTCISIYYHYSSIFLGVISTSLGVRSSALCISSFILPINSLSRFSNGLSINMYKKNAIKNPFVISPIVIHVSRIRLKYNGVRVDAV
uniref:Uncharacterized protein n=1 Tax=Sipha flava TaxID=143950 RepID=A0A2S2Q900_9HEMI